MTRAQRRTRQRTRDEAGAGLGWHESRQATPGMIENPNRGKRHAANAGAFYRDPSAQVNHGQAIYAPLTVHTPILRARKSPRTTSYTI